MDSGKTIGDVCREMRKALATKYGEGEAQAMVRVVISTLKGWSLPVLLANEEREAGESFTARMHDIRDRLLADEPLQYILGEARFYGLTLSVKPGVLIPRPETEELVDLIVKDNRGTDLRVLDLCTGSGAIAIALARNLPFSEVEAIDLSPTAIETARSNNETLKTNVKIIQADIFSYEPDDFFDIIVSNPPYIGMSEAPAMERNVLDHEPHEALFVADDNPLLFYRRIAEIAATHLKPGGRLYLEINPLHADELLTLLKTKGFEPSLTLDIHGKKRFATGSR